MIYGNIEGVRNSYLEKLEELYDKRIDKDILCSEEVIDLLCNLTAILNREISIAINRKGSIVSVAIGDSCTVELPQIDVKEKKLSTVRVIHTHPSGSSRLSAVDISALLKLKLDSMAAVAVEEGKCKDITLGFCTIKDDKLAYEIFEPISLERLKNFNILTKVFEIDEIIKNSQIVEDDSERAILVGVDTEESIDELEELAEACEVNVLYKVLQKRSKIDTAFYVGRGKVEEISLLVQTLGANTVIFDDELSGSQVRNLEENIGAKVIDRTTLILEIFARRARTRESKIQVELAQLKYRIPRLTGLGTVLSRTGGGIGTKGPGEKKLETDRRHIRERVYDLLKELERIRKVRETQRENRSSIPKISLVGYTNAGKSTLRNTLCEIAALKEGTLKEKVFEADMLFATLDITTRAISLPDNRVAALTDTVGFIKKLPHDLVEAFKSTLEEVVYSDLLLHVVDASSENAIEQIEAVDYVLEQLKAKDKPTILLLNKIDKAEEENIQSLKEKFKGTKLLEISAKKRINLEELFSAVMKELPNKLREAQYLIPYSDQGKVAYLHRNAKIDLEEYKDEGTFIKAFVDEETYNKYIDYLVK